MSNLKYHKGAGFVIIRLVLFVIALLFIVLVASVANAHDGRTDSAGCHTNKETGKMHCHLSEEREKELEERGFTVNLCGLITVFGGVCAGGK